jgi:polysaccharide biosynthesis protein PslG
LATCLAIFTAVGAPSPAGAAPPVIPPGGYGFGDGTQMTWLGAEEVNRELDAVAKISATWFRVLIPWTQIETVRVRSWHQARVPLSPANCQVQLMNPACQRGADG